MLKKILLDANIRLIDFKLEFGRLADGTIILADEISPDTCRFWDATTGAHLDKDLFRRDMGGEADAYQEVMKRLLAEALPSICKQRRKQKYHERYDPQCRRPARGVRRFRHL